MSTNKTFAAATIAAALVLGTGVVAMAADATPTPTTSASTAATPTPAPTLTDKQAARQAKQAALAKFKADMAAWQVQKTAYDAAAKPILDAYKAALATAKATKDAALAKLPALPPRPVNPNGHNN